MDSKERADRGSGGAWRYVLAAVITALFKERGVRASAPRLATETDGAPRPARGSTGRPEHRR
jgi:hypothetical protein